MSTEIVTATEIARNFSDALNRVRYQGATLEIKRGAEIVARLSPAGEPKGFPVEKLDSLFATLPRADGEEFLADIHSAVGRLREERDAWDS